MKKYINYLSTILIIVFAVLLLVTPEPCKVGIANGILLCGRVIIPSLYPFTVCVLFIMKSGLLESIEFISPITKLLFKLNAREFSIMLLSFVGGYPVGAKLIDQEISQNRITPKKGGNMLCFCTNAGPAFIITAVGNGFYNSKSIGLLLFVSHIFSSLMLCILFNEKEKINIKYTFVKHTKISATDNFVISASEAASSVLTICFYVILFSGINSYVNFFSQKLIFLKYASYFLEVTNAVTYSENIYITSFVLGFSGLCVMCQIIAIAKNIDISFLKYLFSRILHGLISTTITFILIKIFNISVTTFSNGKSFDFSVLYNTPALAISMLITVTVFFISVQHKKITGKIVEDVV